MAEAAHACSNRRRALIGSWVTPPTTGVIEIERGGYENITINHGCGGGDCGGGSNSGDDDGGDDGGDGGNGEGDGPCLRIVMPRVEHYAWRKINTIHFIIQNILKQSKHTWRSPLQTTMPFVLIETNLLLVISSEFM
jgi:hypothetical protein